MYSINTDVILNRYFSYIRNKEGIKIDILSKDVGIASSYISQWENNKRDLPVEKLDKLFSHFDMNVYELIDNLKNEFDVLYGCFIDYYYMRNSERINEIFKKRSKNTMLYPYHVIVRSLINDQKSQTLIESLRQYEAYLSCEFKQLYCILKCEYHISRKEYKTAITLYTNAIKLSQNPHILSLLYYNRGIVYLKDNRQFECQNDLNEARIYFKESYCHQRNIGCHSTLAVLCACNNRQSTGQMMFDEAFSLCGYFEYGNYMIPVLKDYCLYNIKLGNYEKSLKTAFDLYNKYNQMKKYGECLEIIKACKTTNYESGGTLYTQLMELLKLMIKGDYKPVRECSKKCHRIVQNKGTFILKLIVFEVTSTYFKENKKYSLALRSMSELISLYKNDK